MRSTTVFLSKSAEKDARKIPKLILDPLDYWIRSVERLGLREVRKIPGYHDEPLVGDRRGQRSIRLNRAYRAIYVLTVNGEIEIVEIIEINKHKY